MYAYDAANRLTSTNGITFTWDSNGNLLSDGEKTFIYDKSNRLIGVGQGSDFYSFAYNGLGDRYQQIVNGTTTNYALDINTGLTQVLQDGANSYLYGNSRIDQQGIGDPHYFLGDALGSVRQLVDNQGSLILGKSYNPYGVGFIHIGSGRTSYGYTGEWTDDIGMTYLRGRYYSNEIGRFITKDNWHGELNLPISNNAWLYAFGNPIKYIDPTGMFPSYCHKMPSRLQFEDCVRASYGLNRPQNYDLIRYTRANDSPGCHYEVSPEFPVSYEAPGYFEGSSFTKLINQTNTEIVYDLATMTRAIFYGRGYSISDSTLGINRSLYVGLVGIPKPYFNGFSSQRSIIEDYRGWSVAASLGLSGEIGIIPSPGVFSSRFSGFNLNPIGGSIYGIGFSLGADLIPIFDLGLSVNNATYSIGTNKTYFYPSKNGRFLSVNRGMLRHDLLFGDASPWNEIGFIKILNPLLVSRIYFDSMLSHWVTIFEDLHYDIKVNDEY